jgi:hypothetical protein
VKGEDGKPAELARGAVGATGQNYFYTMEFVEGETLQKLIKRSGPDGHGSLQNSDLFWTLFNPLLNSELTYSEGHPQGSKIDSLNKVLSKMRGEIASMQNAGLHISIVKSECASLSVGQFAVFLRGVRDRNHFLNRIQTGLSYRRVRLEV